MGLYKPGAPLGLGFVSWLCLPAPPTPEKPLSAALTPAWGSSRGSLGLIPDSARMQQLLVGFALLLPVHPLGTPHAAVYKAAWTNPGWIHPPALARRAGSSCWRGAVPRVCPGLGTEGTVSHECPCPLWRWWHFPTPGWVLRPPIAVGGIC